MKLFLFGLFFLISNVYLQQAPRPTIQPDRLAEIFGSVTGFGPNANDTETRNDVTGKPDPNNPCPPGQQCVAYYLCRNGTISAYGENLLDVRIGDDDEPKCQESVDVCCGSEQTTDRSIIDLPSDYTAECGVRNINGISTRVSGKDGETHFGEFPWQIAVLEKFVTEDGTVINTFVCGGSLIHKSVVLSAAHCVAGKPTNTLLMRAGEWDTQTIREPLKHQDRDVAQVINHANFEPNAVVNDVSLIFATQPFLLAEHVRPVCLPPPTSTFDYEKCFASGWGKDNWNEMGSFQIILKKVELPVIPFGICQDLLRNTRLSKYFILDPSFMCAGGEEGKDTCKGDGGSPLVCPHPTHKDQYYQAGIVAWGIGCNDKDVPGVYVNVAKFHDWIENTLKSKGIDSSSYTA